MVVEKRRKTKQLGARPYDYGAALALSEALEVAEPVAIALVRRGYDSVELARRFLEADEAHDPSGFTGIPEVVERIEAAAAAGERVTVFGDYDVDGVCATAVLVTALRALDVSVDWLIPDRLGDGYGLSTAAIDSLAERGTRLLITADCGVTAIAEVARARELGIDVIVTDHHRPGAALPDCLLLHPSLSGYPFDALCGTGVAYKLALALARSSGRGTPELDLDLVAMATVADMVELRGENRTLVRRGLAELRRARRPGIRALIDSSSVLCERLDEGDIAFRLAPRINAAGRLYRADACVELLLTESAERAKEIAAHLEKANHERRRTEQEVLAAAEAELAALPAESRQGRGIVVAGQGWHPGVVGIVASRLVEAHGEPTIVIAIDEAGVGRGSARSIPGFDLLAAISAGAEHLTRFGGHRAAAGLEVEAGSIERFRSDFCASATATLAEHPEQRVELVDAVVGGESLGHSLAEQIRSLGPFGIGNPRVGLLVPWAQVRDVREMGESGRHARFTLESGAGSVQGVAFSVENKLQALAAERHDLTVRLELNEWNGASTPRVVLGESYRPEPAADGATGCPNPADDAEWWARLENAAAVGEDGAAGGERELREMAAESPTRRVLDRRGGSIVARLTELVSSGGGVLVACADAERRRGLLERAVNPARFGAGQAVACSRCSADQSAEDLAEVALAAGGVVLIDWSILVRDPYIGEGFEHVLCVDPPAFEAERLVAKLGDGFVHLAWGAREVELALRIHDREWEMREGLAQTYRELRDATSGGPLSGSPLRQLLQGEGPHHRSAESAGRRLQVLGELNLVAGELSGGVGGLGVVSSGRTELERSTAFRAYSARYEEGRRYLQKSKPKPR